ncbi:Bacteriophytochrome cph2 [Thiorhodovibrio winogradskyi]|uniref:diguanylate cyclase n=1 Tax=Thiorhodovibrio winogradskyi TaxID=77007 RepID=A0ABZ0S8F8_9GAMM|nr:diguanylate cyclase [Thiorhodovibrio winogradskyi]
MAPSSASASRGGHRRENHLATLGLLLFAVILGLFVLVGAHLYRFESERHRQREIEQVKQQLDSLATALKSRIYANIFAVSGVKSLVAMNPELTQEDFSRAMAIQFREQRDLRNIGLARDMVLRLIYPVEGNEGAIGLDYRGLPDQIDAVQQALKLNRIVVAGPLPLVQGGEGLIARIPISVADAASGQERFWGFASVVMNTESIFSAAGITEQSGLRLAIRGRDGRGEQGEVFLGDPGIFDHQPVTQLIELPHGHWQMGATPAGGWTRYSPFSDPLMWSYLAAAAGILAFSAIIVFLLAENRKAGDALKKERDLFSEGPVFTMEWGAEQQGDWPIRRVSSNVAQILGYSQAEMLAPGFSYAALIHPEDAEPVVGRLRQHVAEGTDRYEDSYRVQTRSGGYLWFHDSTLLLRDKAGRITAVRSYLYDQTAQKQAEEALRIAEARLEKTAFELTENIPVGTYTMVQPAEGGMASFAFMSSRFLELTGLTREEAASDPMKGFACVHPDDFDAWVARNVETFNEKKPFFGEVRVVVKGETRWITAESFPRTLSDGTTVWEGVLADVTDRKRAEEALSESLRRFNDLVDRVSVGVYVFWHRANGKMEFEYVSDSWCEMNQIRREDLLENPWLAWNIVHPDEFEAFRQLNEQVVRERRSFVWEGQILVDGNVRFVLIESSPIFFANGDSRWFGFEQDITERKHAEAILQETNLALTQEINERKLVEQELKVKTELLEQLSMQDGLTGIANRRYFDQRVEAEWKRVLRTGLPLSLVLIDIDHFKQYNDHYGHGAGDACLRQVAQALARCAERPLDLVARYGGEEFIALLPETERNGALHLAEQMRAGVEALAIPHARSSAAAVVTLSIGVATHGPGRVKTDLRQLQECADQALYRGKHQGRNQVQEEVLAAG